MVKNQEMRERRDVGDEREIRRVLVEKR